MDPENQTWAWGCKVKTLGHVAHPRKSHSGDAIFVGPEEWAQCRLQYLHPGYSLPDYLMPDVLPKEAGGTHSYDDVAKNIRKCSSGPFQFTDREEWLSIKGSQFEEMMTGDYGHGIQHLDFDIGDLGAEMLPQDRTPNHLFRSIDIDSGMGWLPSLGTIHSDLTLFLYPFSNRNFDASIHLTMKIDKRRIPIHKVNHFLFGEFGSVNQRPIQLYLFVPTLYDSKSKSNRINDSLKDAFISDCLIPAAREVLPDLIMEQFGRSMREIKSDCEAPIYEGQIYGPAGHRLSGGVTIPEKYLAALWQECQNKLQITYDERLLVFKDCRLFWTFKGAKYGAYAEDYDEIEKTINNKVSYPSFNMLNG